MEMHFLLLLLLGETSRVNKLIATLKRSNILYLSLRILLYLYFIANPISETFDNKIVYAFLRLQIR